MPPCLISWWSLLPGCKYLSYVAKFDLVPLVPFSLSYCCHLHFPGRVPQLGPSGLPAFLLAFFYPLSSVERTVTCPRSAVLLCVSVCSKPSALPASLSSKLCSWTHANLLFLSPCSLCKLPQRAPRFPCQGSVQAGAPHSCPCGAEVTFVSIAGFPMFILFLLLIICIWVGVGCAYRYRRPWRPEALTPLVLELQAL